MTILVVFGNKGTCADKFNFDHLAYVSGYNEDRIYFAEDSEYSDNAPLNLPSVTDKTLLPVIQHNSSDYHKVQLKWLERATNYSPVNVLYFSHGPGKEPFETIKQLLNLPTGEEENQKRVSDFVKQYSNQAVLKYLDNCAAWNVLSQVSKDLQHDTEMIKYRDLLQPFIGEKLYLLEDEALLLALKEASSSFC